MQSFWLPTTIIYDPTASSLSNNDSNLPNDIKTPTPPNNQKWNEKNEFPLPLIPPIGTSSFNSKVKIELLDKKLWINFNKHTTEMIVTRPGR